MKLSEGMTEGESDAEGRVPSITTPTMSATWNTAANGSAFPQQVRWVCQREVFESREKEIGELALRVLRERLTLTVFTTERSRHIVRLLMKDAH
jgi:hypothetical protein